MAKNKKDELEQNELVDVLTKKYEEYRPYMPVILSVAGVVIAVIVGASWYFYNQGQKRDARWAELSEAMRAAYTTERGNSKVLTEFADAHPDTDAALWASFVAGDIEINGVGGASYTDKEAVVKRYQAAKTELMKVIESSRDKDKMLERRAMFALAYAHEGLGEFDDAEKLYQQLVEEGEDAPLFAAATRGLARTQSKEIRDFYTLYQSWETSTGDAPGKLLPRIPDISFPGLPEKKPAPGGQFTPEDPNKKSDDDKSGDSDLPPTPPKSDDKKDDGSKADDKKSDDKKSDDKAKAENKSDDKKSTEKKSDDKKSAGEDKKK